MSTQIPKPMELLMTKFNVPEMTCNHCKASIEKAIRVVDAAAHVDVDLAAKTVAVDSKIAEAAIVSAIKEAGYEATALG